MVLVLLCWLRNNYFHWLSAFSTAEPEDFCSLCSAATSALNYSLNERKVQKTFGGSPNALPFKVFYRRNDENRFALTIFKYSWREI